MADFNFDDAFAVVKDDLTEAQQKALKEARADITDVATFNAVKNAIKRTVVNENSDERQTSPEASTEKENKKENESHQPTGTGQSNSEQENNENPQGEGKPQTNTEENAGAESQGKADKTPQEIEQEKLAESRKVLEGLDTDKRNLNPQEVAKALETKETGHSIEALAQMQLVVREAEFKEKYKLPLSEADKKILANKDRLTDEILVKMEGLASGTEKIGKGLDKEVGKTGHDGKTDYERLKNRKKSFNVLYENAPEELKQHCHKTLEKANKRVNNSQGVSSERLSKATAKKLKYKKMQIQDSDGLWTVAKKTVQMKMFTSSRSAKKGLKKWWQNGRIGKAARGVVDNKFRRGFRRWRSKVGNRVSLLPSRTKKAIKKGWNKYIAGPIAKFWKEKVVKKVFTPAKNFLNNKIYQPTKKFVNSKIIEPAKKSIDWVKKNPKKALAAGVMIASAGMGFAVGGPAGAFAATKVAAMGVAGVTAAYYAGKGTVAAAKATYNFGKKGYDKTKKAIDNEKENIKDKLKESFEKNQQKVPNREDTDKEISYAQGRKVFNEHPDEMKTLLDNYKKAIAPEGNNGTPKDDKEAAVQLYQSMIASKDRGGLGLQEEDAQAVMSYFNQNKQVESKFENIKDEINKQPEDKSVENENKEKPQTGNEETKKKPNPMNALEPEQKEQLGFALKAYHANIASSRVTEEQAAMHLSSILSKPKEEGGLGLSPERTQEMKDYLGYKGVVAGWKKGKTQNEENTGKTKTERGKSSVYESVKQAERGR
ncbi:MAG: hypothetical protein IJ545_08505 [Alphaproteobacteria bacterium]|nr:hypothetical protein [Alphaproteobacteria bacterium]